MMAFRRRGIVNGVEEEKRGDGKKLRYMYENG